MNWSPFMNYVWSPKQMRAWVDHNGASAMYNGRLWEIKHKRIVPGRYKVWFEEVL